MGFGISILHPSQFVLHENFECIVGAERLYIILTLFEGCRDACCFARKVRGKQYIGYPGGLLVCLLACRLACPPVGWPFALKVGVLACWCNSCWFACWLVG